MKAEAGDDPNHTYPLRDVDIQFQVEHKKGPQKMFLGSLTYGQLMREAYPGAVYYYTAKPYRVYRVRVHSRLVEVRHEKRYTTKPQMLPTLLFPNLTAENVYVSRRYGNLTAIECSLQVRESVLGFKEQRGPNELAVNYPLDYSSGLYFNQPRFTRNYFTTGVVFAHPVLNNANVHRDTIANFLFEMFLMVIPFERHDIHFGSDKYRAKRGPINEEDKFISIYDQTYGSLRLSGRILEEQVLTQVLERLEKIVELIRHDKSLDKNSETIIALEQILESLSKQPTEFSFDSEDGLITNANRFEKIIMPGSKGLNVKKGNEEFFIDSVFFSPVVKGLAYRGKHISEKIEKYKDAIISIPVDSLKEIPGESKLGLYNYETGEIKELE